MSRYSDKIKSAHFAIKRANEWIESAKTRPEPEMLFGEFWLEGELSILFADTGKGKSLLAVQIAESIASGKPIDPMPMTARAQKVVYFDFELTDKQFEMRYAGDEGDDAGTTSHYRFSDDFYRAEIDVVREVPGKKGTLENYVATVIDEIVARSDARVIIIDNITYLTRSLTGSADAIALMRLLRQLKTEYGLSILVLAHTPKRHTKRPLCVNDLLGSRMLANFADNIFAIGQSHRESDLRYLKHIKPRSTEMICDFGSLPSFVIARGEDNMLGFRFRAFTPESDHFVEGRHQAVADTLENIRRLLALGHSQRAVARELEISRSKVIRYLQIWGTGDPEKYLNDEPQPLAPPECEWQEDPDGPVDDEPQPLGPPECEWEEEPDGPADEEPRPLAPPECEWQEDPDGPVGEEIETVREDVDYCISEVVRTQAGIEQYDRAFPNDEKEIPRRPDPVGPNNEKKIPRRPDPVCPNNEKKIPRRSERVCPNNEKKPCRLEPDPAEYVELLHETRDSLARPQKSRQSPPSPDQDATDLDP